MIKKLNLLVLVFILISCNSSEKKKIAIDYPAKTSLTKKNLDLKASMKRGKLIYNDMCITCHLADGKGVPRAFPPIANSDFLRKNQDESIKGIKKGMSGEMIVNGITYNSAMAPLGLLDEEIADVMNYINNSWGNKIDNFVTPEKVSRF